ncbi:MAG: glycosyltransferase family 2 protein [Myxococcales bacterium]|nr:glycosyltransferase family 2 protein [Myxococcales bacterium]
MNAPALSVVVIAFNEEESLEGVVEELLDEVRGAKIAFECVLVDDGSRDGTLAAMRRLEELHSEVRVVALPENGGIGAALRGGFDAARGDYVTWVPADGQIPPNVVVDLFAQRDRAAMLTTVYRTRDDVWIRHVISSSLNWMIRMRTGRVAKSGGNYLFRRAAWLDHAPPKDDSMMISTGFRHRLREAGESIEEVEIDCRARVAGHSKVLNPRAIWRTFRALLAMGRDGKTS